MKRSFVVVAWLFASLSTAIASEPPAGVERVPVAAPDEASGVASVADGFVVVGDGEPRTLFFVPQQTRRPITFGNASGNICDPEAVDVGITPDGETRTFVLGEDARSVFIKNGNPIRLPPEFYERCNRGAEGLSVRWRDGSWDLVVVSEGGVPGRRHAPNSSKTNNCNSVALRACPIERAVYNPLMARYRVAADGRSAELTDLNVLPTARLLEEIDPTQGFRASDVTWWGEDVLVLLGSTPTSGNYREGFRHTWIKGFTVDGKAVPGLELRLEQAWGAYRDNKNWEGLDTLADGRRLVLSYDVGGRPSELSVFEPNFARDRDK